MVLEGDREIGVKISQPGGKKLLSNLTEHALILHYILPDGRSWKRLWEGWVGSFTMLLVLLEHHARKISRMEGKGMVAERAQCAANRKNTCKLRKQLPQFYNAHAENAHNTTKKETSCK